ncbi:glycosyltransferase family 2 protein [Chloroflexota bacterium]
MNKRKLGSFKLDVTESNRRHEYPIIYVRIKQNYYPCLCRNIGITYLKGDIVCFLEGDDLADKDFVWRHLTTYWIYTPLGVRGRILPTNESNYNILIARYDMGINVFPSPIDMEGNASFPRSILLKVG